MLSMVWALAGCGHRQAQNRAVTTSFGTSFTVRKRKRSERTGRCNREMASA